jgi:murein DD-endopeptidase MepM/ murein hydrolase activator NlpD
VTVARSGDTAIVVDTTGPPDSLGVVTHYEVGTDSPTVDSVGPLVTAGSDIAALRAQGMVVPVAGIAAKDLVDSFDDKRGGSRQHNAIDIMAARNTPAVAATDGSIAKLHNSNAGGLTIYMKDRTGRFMLMYGHLDSYRPGLTEGAPVRRGEIIGFVGSTGNANPLAPHLHFQVMRIDNPKDWWRGTPLNPFLIYRPAE